MKDSVSSRRVSVLGLIAQLSVAWVACSIFIPYGFPWMALGCVGLALFAALWLSMRSTRYTACLNRRVYCDRSRLTPSEAASIPPEVQ